MKKKRIICEDKAFNAIATQKSTSSNYDFGGAMLYIIGNGCKRLFLSP